MPEIKYEEQPEELKPLEVLDDDGNLILPSSIDTSQHFYGAFEENRTEISANWIVRLCQEKGGWLPFTREEINDFRNKFREEKRDFDFNGLAEPKRESLVDGRSHITGGGFIKMNGDKYFVTESFVRRAYKSSPVKK